MAPLLKKGMTTIYVSDVNRAVKFYSEILGMRVKSHAGEHFAELEMPGVLIGLHPTTKMGPKPGTSGSISIGFEVDDLDSAVSKLKENGVVFHGKISEDGPVRLAFFTDPDSNPLYLTQVKKNNQWG